MKTNNNNNGSFVPVIIYNNADIDKLQILKDNKGRTGIYMWVHESGKIYVGSAVDLSKRISEYFSIKYLDNNKKMYICNALNHHGYAAFSLLILEYIDIANLSKEQANKLILGQFFIDSLSPEYNINPTAGSRLGSKHTEEAKILMSKAKTGENHPMFGLTHSTETIVKMSENHLGKIHSEETKAAKLSETHKGKILSEKTKALISEALAGINNPMFNRSHSEETKAKMSEALKGENNPFFGKNHSAETKALMSTKVLVYSIDTISNEKTFFKSFDNYSEAALYFNCSKRTLSNYVDKNKLYKKQWILSTSQQ
jgi:group I intron endonuclease